MIKSILLGLNFIILLLIGSFQKNEPTIVQDLPTTLEPGEEAVITVHFNKSNITGFAKFQLTLAPGLRAESIDNAGASFTFNNHKAKFIWMALPTDKTFVLTYRIIAEQNAVGNLAVDGRFSYIYENERKNYDTPTQHISVGSPDAIAAQRIKNSLQAEASNDEASATIEREIISVGINQWRVDITLHKSNLRGFAKIQENLPDGYTVINLKASSAIFSIADRKLKYIWYDIPQNEFVVVSYKMLPVIAMAGLIPTITGQFSYLQNEVAVAIPIEGGVEKTAEPDEILAELADTSAAKVLNKKPENSANLAQNTENNEPKAPSETKRDVTPAIPQNDSDTAGQTKIEESQSDVNRPEIAAAEETLEPAVTTENEQATETPSTKNRTDGNIVNVPDPETGIFYRVQIAAGKNNLRQPLFASIYRFDEKFNIENINGLFKYTTGHFQVYKAARDGRERITAQYEKFQGPFVTAYNSGERITVQEALMVTSQRWYQ